MKRTTSLGLVAWFAGSVTMLSATPLPAPGEWDGVTPSAKLATPYEDPHQATIRFGLISYFAHPWRSYMDTWPAAHFLSSMGCVWNVPDKYSDAVCELMSESGIRQVRYECGWGNFDWDNHLTGPKRAETIAVLQRFKRYGLRPLLLLNSHHAAPCPIRSFPAMLVADAHKGDRLLQLKDASKVRVGYTGPMHLGDYCAAKPLITRVNTNGTCELSMPLEQDFKAGSITLYELKYRPLEGLPESNATIEGWEGYVREMCALAAEVVGDAGFDLEVWNELTFGANFLDINRYYNPPLKISEPLRYQIKRPLQPTFRPDAKQEFTAEAVGVLLAKTCEYVAAHYPGVRVDDGTGNQWPWNSGTHAWPGQRAYSRHYYLGDSRDISPTSNSRPELDTINALGERDGKRPEHPKDWCDIIPGSNFISTMRVGLPEWHYCGFQTESIVRDRMPDSRLSGMDGHGRYTHNGDLRPAEMYQTEFNFSRLAFFDQLFKDTGASREDPRAVALDGYLAGKMMVRMYLFQNHKGLDRLYVFAPGEGAFNFNMLTPRVYQALDKSGGKLTPEVRATLPPGFAGLKWLTQQMETGEPIVAPRPLRVDELIEYKPRLQYAGDGSPARPHQWNRDWFAFLPYQLSANRFIVPYYVVTIDVNHVWDARKDPLDPTRYDMPEQEFDITIGNCAGKGATVSAFDPLTTNSVPVQIIASTKDTLAVRLKATDYPRVLIINEAKPGPQILDPIVTFNSVKWRTNIKPDSLKVTYGHDWSNRSANVIEVPPGKTEVALPAGLTGVVAARIIMSAGGLTDVWPRWDEDPAGQVVIPGSVAVPVSTAKVESQKDLPPVSLVAPVGINLPDVEVNAVRGYSVRLPKGVVLSGSPDDREAKLGAATLRIRYVTDGAKRRKNFLSFVAVGDIEQEQSVRLPGDISAAVVDLQLQPAAHPGMTNLRQRHLLAPLGADLLVISVTGPRDAVETQDKLINAIFAGMSRTLR